MAFSLNQITLVGRIGNIKEGSYDGSFWMNFSIATDRPMFTKDKPIETKTDWHSVSVWRERALLCKKYLRVGDYISVTGELRYEPDKKDPGKLWPKIFIPDYGKILFLGPGLKRSDFPEQETKQTPVQQEIPVIDGPKPYASNAKKVENTLKNKIKEAVYHDDIPF